MRWGLDISQHQLDWNELVARATLAEDAGLDGVWVFDHFKALYGDPRGPALEAWTLLAGLARETSRVRLGTLVTGMTHRHPSVLAAEVVTVDHLSGGRVECAVGAAWNDSEHRELGIPFPPTAERLDRLEEGVQVLRLLFTEDDATFEGRHYRLEGATYRPRPVQQPHPPIWVGGEGRRRTLPIVGRYADAWHGWASNPAELAEIIAIIDRAAEDAGRDPASIVRASSLSISEPWDEVAANHECLYAVHGIARVASQDDIRKGHRKLVHEYHPDANPGDLGTEECFNEIQHAYEILSDPEKKRQYDESLKTGAGADRRGDGSGAPHL